ncbi:hypothetical protein EVAR_76868_1 [Eumeta japonica]|uniref:Uncharacterized protein n=1 Tax=Eumeta variegata TaxID=151549 RepID=A0A4C1SEI8_EUMVA|nr:hypothetical protein EVAR_76868_1 [Eumeta japonica]
MVHNQKHTIGTHGAARCAGGRMGRRGPRALNATITPTPDRCVFGLRNIYIIGVHIVTKKTRSERTAARSVLRGGDCHLEFDRLALREESRPSFVARNARQPTRSALPLS